MIKQIRVFVGFILQPDLKLPKIVPDPRINTERDESSHTHLTVFTTLRSFRDKAIYKRTTHGSMLCSPLFGYAPQAYATSRHTVDRWPTAERPLVGRKILLLPDRGPAELLTGVTDST